LPAAEPSTPSRAVSEKLVDAFIDRLFNEGVSILVRHNVVRVETSERGVNVHAFGASGIPVSETFDRVICAVPASAATRIDFQPNLNPAKRNAFASISYLGASKSAALFRRRFWETNADQPQLGGVTNTDLENQQIWFPHDNLTYDDQEGPDVPLTVGVPTERLRTPFAIRQQSVSQQPGSALLAYMWGDNARRFSSLSGEAKDDLIIRNLESIYPGAAKELVELVHWSWDAQTNPGGGAFAWYQPGQQSRYQEAAMRPHPDKGAKVFFAGEHLGLIQGWIQSAMTTALDAVLRACNAKRL
jgi:monoamine oxidase